MKEAQFSKCLLAVALAFLAGAIVLHSRAVRDVSDSDKAIRREIDFARQAYKAVGREIAEFASRTAAAETREALAEATAEFQQNLTSVVGGLRMQGEISGTSQNSSEVRVNTGVNAKSTIERTEDLAIKLIIQTGMLADSKDGSVDPKLTAIVTSEMQKTFDDSKQRQATALGGMLKESVEPKAAKKIAEKLPAEWKDVGKTVALDDSAAKKALAKAEKEEKAVAKDTRAQLAPPGATGNASKKTSFGASAKIAAQLAAKAQTGQPAQPGMGQAQQPPSAAPQAMQSQASMAAPTYSKLPSPSSYPQPSAPPQDMPDTALKLDVVDEVLMAYRDKHMPNDDDSPPEIWDKMRWMLKMGFDGRALDCLDDYRDACLAESGENELDFFTSQIVDSAEKFIKEMRDLKVSGGVMVSSVIEEDVAASDAARGLESYEVGDIITSIGTNDCCSVDELMNNYSEGEPIQLFHLYDKEGSLTKITQKASGQDLGKTYKFKEISK